MDNVISSPEGVAIANSLLLDFYLKNSQMITSPGCLSQLSQRKIAILNRSKGIHFNKFCEPYEINAEQLCYDYTAVSQRTLEDETSKDL